MCAGEGTAASHLPTGEDLVTCMYMGTCDRGHYKSKFCIHKYNFEFLVKSTIVGTCVLGLF